MKRIIIILSTLLTLCVAGVLYGNHLQTDVLQMTSFQETYTAQFPEQMTDVVLDPIVGFPVY